MISLNNFANCYVIHHLNQGTANFLDNQKSLYSKDASKSIKIILIVLTTVNFIALFFVANLIFFHIMLRVKGLTTYEYVKI